MFDPDRLLGSVPDESSDGHGGARCEVHEALRRPECPSAGVDQAWRVGGLGGKCPMTFLPSCFSSVILAQKETPYRLFSLASTQHHTKLPQPSHQLAPWFSGRIAASGNVLPDLPAWTMESPSQILR